MPVHLDKVSVERGESFFVFIEDSAEKCLHIKVSNNGHCFVSGPFNTNQRVFELTIEGMKETSAEERDKSL